MSKYAPHIKRILGIRLKKRTLVALVALAITLTSILIVSVYRFALRNERIREFADLQAMRNACLTAKNNHRIGDFEAGVYYIYDANHYRLISPGAPGCAPYGRGTIIDADVTDSFNDRYGTDYEYHGRERYVGKVIRLIGTVNENDELAVQMEWVDSRVLKNEQSDR